MSRKRVARWRRERHRARGLDEGDRERVREHLPEGNPLAAEQLRKVLRVERLREQLKRPEDFAVSLEGRAEHPRERVEERHARRRQQERRRERRAFVAGLSLDRQVHARWNLRGTTKQSQSNTSNTGASDTLIAAAVPKFPNVNAC